MNVENHADTPAVEIDSQDADDFLHSLLAALRAAAKADHVVRRCLEHHVELDHLQCPTGQHPTRADKRLMEIANHTGTNSHWTGDLWRWEVFNKTTGHVVARVMGDTVEWEEGAEEDALLPRLSGRQKAGFAGGLRPVHRVERDIGRPGRRRSSDGPRWGPRLRVA